MIIAFKITKIDENLSSILEKEPRFFEHLVTELLEKMDYGTGSLTNKGPDGGIDGIIDEDELGLSKIYIQAKRYKDGSNIGRQEIQQFIVAISNKNTKKRRLYHYSEIYKRGSNVCQR